MLPVNPLLDDTLSIGPSLPALASAASASGVKGGPSFSPDIVAIAQRAGTLDPTAAYQETVDGCTALLKDITQRLNDAAMACVVQCADSIDQCCACFRAKAGVTAESVQAVLDKCQGKIEKSVTAAYAATVGNLVQMGCTFPTPDQIQAVMAGVSPDLTVGQTLPNALQIVAADNKPIAAPPGQVGSGVTEQPVAPLPSPIQNKLCPSHDENGNPLIYPCPVGYWGETDENGCFYCRPGPGSARGVLYPNGSGGFGHSPLGGQKPAPLGANIPAPEGTPAPTNCTQNPDGTISCNVTVGGPGGNNVVVAGPPAKPQPAPSPIPSPGTPTLVDGVCCYPPTPTQMIGCRQLPPPAPPPVLYWATCERDCCGAATVCIYAGYTPPVVPTATKLYGPSLTADGAVACIPQPSVNCGVASDVTTYCQGSVTNGTGSGTGTGGSGSGLDQGTTGGTGGPDTGGGSGTGSTGTGGGGGGISGGGSTGSGGGGTGGSTDGTGTTGGKPLGSFYCDPQSLANYYRSPLQSTAIATDLSQTIISELGGFLKIDCDPFPTGTGWICDALNGVLSLVSSKLVGLFSDAPCLTPEFLSAASTHAGLGFLRQWTGAIPDAVSAANQYAMNLACQFRLLSTGELNNLNVRGWINDDAWQAGVAANGDCVPWQELARDASFRYPALNESLALFMRGWIDQNTYYAYAKRDGVKDSQWADQYWRLAQFIPPVAESQLWHQRSINDDANAETLSLDERFDLWWASEGNRSASSQGISYDVARRQWRNSWQLPALSVALEAYRRIPEPFRIPGTDRVANPVTPDELSALADVQRMPDGWADRQMALSYTPVTIRHLRMLLVSGVIDEQGLSQRYQRLGYTPDDSDLLARANVITARPQIAAIGGLPSQSEILRLYSDDAISETDAIGMLTDIGIEAGPAVKLVQTADSIRDAKWRRKQIEVIRRRFLIGDFSGQDATQELLAVGVATEKITRITNNWNDELRLKRKEPAVAMLCDWFTRGYIDATTYVARLIRLGYSTDDAERIQQSCGAKYTDKQLKQLASSLARVDKMARAAKRANEPCRPRPKQLCGVATKRVHSVIHDDTGKKGPKITDTTETQTTEQQGDTTILEKIEEKHLTPG